MSDEKSSAPDLNELSRKSVRQGAITLAAQGVTFLLKLVSTIVTARLLTPADFGMLAMVLAITTFAGLFRDLGLSSASIQKGQLTQEQMSTIFWINAGMGTLLTVVVALLSPVVAWFYGQPQLVHLTMMIAPTFLLSALGAQHLALMQRHMQFGRIAVGDIFGGVVTLGVSVLLAQAGLSYWALALGIVAGTAATTVMYFLYSSFRPRLVFRGDEIRSMMGFGAHVTVFDLIFYFQSNMDSMLIGRVWGGAALGLYNRAYQLLMLPIINIRKPINAVAYPAMSRLRERPEEFRLYYCRITALLAFLSMPLTLFLAINAHEVIDLTLGRNWVAAAPIYSILAVAGFIQPIAGLRGLVMLSMGETKRYMQWGLINTVCVCAGFVVGVHWGVLGVAIAYAVVSYLLLYPSLVLAFRNTPLSNADFFRSIARPGLSSIVAALVALACDHFLRGMHDLEFITFSFWIFSLVFIAAFVLMPGGRGELLGYIRGLRALGGRAGAAA